MFLRLILSKEFKHYANSSVCKKNYLPILISKNNQQFSRMCKLTYVWKWNNYKWKWTYVKEMAEIKLLFIWKRVNDQHLVVYNQLKFTSVKVFFDVFVAGLVLVFDLILIWVHVSHLLSWGSIFSWFIITNTDEPGKS